MSKRDTKSGKFITDSEPVISVYRRVEKPNYKPLLAMQSRLGFEKRSPN